MHNERDSKTKQDAWLEYTAACNQLSAALHKKLADDPDNFVLHEAEWRLARDELYRKYAA